MPFEWTSKGPICIIPVKYEGSHIALERELGVLGTRYVSPSSAKEPMRVHVLVPESSDHIVSRIRAVLKEHHCEVIECA